MLNLGQVHQFSKTDSSYHLEVINLWLDTFRGAVSLNFWFDAADSYILCVL